MRLAPRLLALLGALLLGACTTPIDVGDSSTPGYPAARLPTSELQGCHLFVASVSDSRLDLSTIGNLGPRVVHGPADSKAWVENALASLEKKGATLSFADRHMSSAPGDLSVSLTLQTMWVAGMTTAKTGAVVIDAAYDRDGARLKDAHYRGAESEPNWFGSADEVQGMIDSAMEEVLSQMSADIGLLCRHSPQS
ncbi:MAG TPA: hypothetical protein VG328_11910 [Stellaceae bacterium]|jgi:hypothetical protein|nr:hypothetical protein [Stellaceae bacterium]